MFPKRIFQTWKQKSIDNPILKNWQQSWMDKNIEYEYELWDDAENRLFIEKNYPDFLKIYDGYDMNIKRVDAVRYFYLLKNGGIYADLDFVCLKPFNSILENIDSDVILGTLGEDGIDESKKQLNFLHNIPNAIMIAKPNSDFFSFVVDMLYHTWNISNLSPEAATGPIFLKICLLCYTTNSWPDYALLLYKRNIFEEIKHKYTFESKIFLTSPEIFYPINWNNEKSMSSRREMIQNTNFSLENHFPSSFAITFWMHSW